MSKTLAFLGSCFGMLALTISVAVRTECPDADASACIYLVRHAEKASAAEDPPLSEAGELRALELANLLQDVGIGAIYSTDLLRTRETAAPLASRLGLEIRIYDWHQMGDLAAGMIGNGGRYLVVGHSNTTHELVEILGGEPGSPIDERGEYDRLYLVTVKSDGSVTTALRRYGKPYER